MTVHDALAVTERDARAATVTRLREMSALVESATFDALTGRRVSTKALEIKASSVTEAVAIWDATRTAQAAAIIAGALAVPARGDA